MMGVNAGDTDPFRSNWTAQQVEVPVHVPPPTSDVATIVDNQDGSITMTLAV
jgi:hypothetical protein